MCIGQTDMDDVISQYQRWKEQGEGLRSKAKQAMETRFHQLLVEAIRIAEEYKVDFGGTLKPPVQVTAFRYKPGAKGKGKKVAAKSKPGSAPAPAPVVAAAPAAPSAKTIALEKKLAQARKKLETAKAAGQPTRNLEDRVYEIEDELRLSTGGA
ncbi:MAG: hypothetical protein IT168_19545 [Bryobacterales bacterium]|nr:hypothetical protein [Bryobacterales bacterium]